MDNNHNIKILYVTGDSYGFGQGLKAHNLKNFYGFNEELRRTVYSGIIADTWKIPNYMNTSRPGCSNNRLLRKIMYDIPKLLQTYKAEEIFINISYTHTARVEFFSVETQRHYPLIPNFYPNSPHFPSHNELWKTYVTHFDHVKEHVDRHFMNIVSMQKFLDSLGVRYLITRSMTEHHTFHTEVVRGLEERKGLMDQINPRTFPEDLEPCSQFIHNNKLKFTPCLHPDEEGHQRWAEHLMKYMTEKGFV
jgi:hypothetical protein